MVRKLVIVQLLVMGVIVLAGCTATPFPPDLNNTDYPAVIFGDVVKPERFESEGMSGSGVNIWVVTASFKNIEYADPEYIVAFNWYIETEDKLYSIAQGISWDDGGFVSREETVTMTLAFFVPQKLSLQNAVLRYDNKDKISYGTLSGGHHIPGYDWETKSPQLR